MVIPAGTQTAELISVALLQSPRRQPSTPGSPWAESQPAAGIWGDRGTPLGCSMHWDSLVASLQSDHSQNSGDCAFGNQQPMRASSPGICAPGLPVSRETSPALPGGIWLKVPFLDHLLHPTAPNCTRHSWSPQGPHTMLPSLFLEMLQVSLMNWDSSFKTPTEAFPEEAARPLPLALPSNFSVSGNQPLH